MYIITGVCGVGKSTVIPFLQEKLGSKYEVKEFDERGLPAIVTKKWKETEVKKWFEYAEKLLQQNKVLVLCGVIRYANLKPFLDAGFNNFSPKVILLHAQDSIIRKRLENRYQHTKHVNGKETEIFIDEILYTQKQMKNEYSNIFLKSIDVSLLTPKEVSTKMYHLVKN